MDLINNLKQLLNDKKNDEAIQLLPEIELAYNSKEFAINKLEQDQQTIQRFLQNTLVDINAINTEKEAIRIQEEQLKDELIRRTQYHLDKIINEISSD